MNSSLRPARNLLRDVCLLDDSYIYGLMMSYCRMNIDFFIAFTIEIGGLCAAYVLLIILFFLFLFSSGDSYSINFWK